MPFAERLHANLVDYLARCIGADKGILMGVLRGVLSMQLDPGTLFRGTRSNPVLIKQGSVRHAGRVMGRSCPKRWGLRGSGNRHPTCDVKLSKHGIEPLDDAHIRALSECALRVLTTKVLAELKEAHDRLWQNPSNRSRAPSSRPTWADEPPVGAGEAAGSEGSDVPTRARQDGQARGDCEQSKPSGSPRGKADKRVGTAGHGRTQRLEIDAERLHDRDICPSCGAPLSEDTEPARPRCALRNRFAEARERQRRDRRERRDGATVRPTPTRHPRTLMAAVYAAREDPPGQGLRERHAPRLDALSADCICHADAVHDKTPALARGLLSDWDHLLGGARLSLAAADQQLKWTPKTGQ